jgi:hypothetical protein
VGAEKRVRPFVENITEATSACLVTMVQGNLLALTLSHWLVASQTGITAGVVTSAAILASRIQRPWLISLMLGLVTAGVDYWVHPGGFGPFFLEAIVTGAGAAALSFAVQMVTRWIRRRAAARSPNEETDDEPLTKPTP